MWQCRKILEPNFPQSHLNSSSKSHRKGQLFSWTTVLWGPSESLVGLDAGCVSPGKHRVKIALPGYQAFETEVNLLPRQKITIKTNLVPGSITQAGPSIKKD